MGSGCNSSSSGNRPVTKTPDTGVVYTGPEIEALGICTGDYLDEITAVVVQKLIDYATGLGITLPEVDLEACDFLDGFTACCMADKTLTGLMNGVLKSLCTLKSNIEEVKEDVNENKDALTYTLVPGCLDIENPKIDTLLNKLISDYCTFKTKVTAIFGNIDDPVLNTTIVNQITDSVINNVFDNIKGCRPTDIVKTGSGIDTQIQIMGLVPVLGIVFGTWDSSYFDATGLGLASKGMCGWAACNGENLTIDLRGFTLGMATNIPSSKPLHPSVDPLVFNDATYATNIGDRKGEVKHILRANESGMPSHNHDAEQDAHSHTFPVSNASGTSQGTHVGASDGIAGTVFNQATDSAQPDVTVGYSAELDAQAAHENRQPTYYVYAIQRIN